MMKRRVNSGDSLLNDERLRKQVLEGRTLYAAVDVVSVLSDSQHPMELWGDLKQREPGLADAVTVIELDGSAEDALNVEGVFRLIQSMPGDRAERLRRWLASTARERMEETENPELAILRTQQAYQQHGYDKDWISKRLQSIGGRRELAREWYRRGIRQSDEFRNLTNELLGASFGMDVNTYRRYKGLWRSGQNLRDHMTDLEVALVSLGETVAANLHRQRRSNGFEALNADAKDAGTIVAGTRAEIERQTGHSVVSALNHAVYKPRCSAGDRPAAQQIQTRKDVAA
jgi:DNA-damage-inducible protein D